jgi:hypothetical protein
MAIARKVMKEDRVALRALAQQMTTARAVMKRRRNALRELAKR